jgi:hypothetical protein
MAFTSFLSTLDTALKEVLFLRYQEIFSLADRNKGVLQFPKVIAQREMAEKRGTLDLDFISFWKPSCKYSWNRQKTSAARRGLYVGQTDSTSSTHVKAVPVDVTYEITFWSKSLDRINQALESYFLWQQENTILSIKYNDLWDVDPQLHFGGETSDFSTVGEKFDKGTIFCFTVPIKLDGWIFESVVGKTILKIQVTYRDSTNLSESEQSSVFVDDSSYDADLDALVKLFRENIYQILNVDIVNRSFYVKAGCILDFVINQKIYVNESTGNNGVYTIEELSSNANHTIIKVSEIGLDSTVDGTISFMKVETK